MAVLDHGKARAGLEKSRSGAGQDWGKAALGQGRARACQGYC
jgi:hypothetical protein